MKVFLLTSIFGEYDDRTIVYNGIFSSYELAEASRIKIKSIIKKTIEETNYILDINSSELNDTEFDEFLIVMYKRRNAIEYVDSYIEEFEIDKLKTMQCNE